ncbi:hypothetical protein KsCSTR_43950 [Candidatus Kuenenia stuttgartiensis]|uniref:Uncharacterized protein n=1 Tax=Kuenenia stuttgartiensis TaxID=174633 RepID=Q1PWZ8_KUEST|nr:hypothetical protein KsCSTR_43950 [Candidatus Kuenenia stuttgartiensis]CAJ71746.1 unknown protein [Candidatus Kuenenia stuttgartiensis]
MHGKHDIKNTKFEVRNTKQIQNIQQYEARNARYEKGVCLEFQIISSLEFVSDFTSKYFAKKCKEITYKVLNV